MARAYGSSAHLLLKRETVYGQAATGNYIRVPFNRCSMGSEQGLIDDPVLGQGRDPLSPLQDVINDEGDIVVPVDPRYLGLWLTNLFGDPDTTDNLDGSWGPRVRLRRRRPAELYGRGGHAQGAGVLSPCRSEAQLDRAGVHPLGPGGRHDQRHRPGRNPIRHEPGRHTDQPDLQPHQPVPRLDQTRRQPGRELDRRIGHLFEGQLDAALTEQFVADVSAGNAALTSEAYRRAVHIKASGAATAGRTVTLQAIKKLSVISNFSATDSVDFILGSATITLDPAEDAASPTMALVYTDGTANGLYAVSSGIGGGGGGALYDLGFYYSGGPPGASELLCKWVAARDLDLPVDFSGSVGEIGTSPTAQFDVDVAVEGASIGTISIATNGTFTFTTTGGTAKSIAAGEVLTITAPASADATAADIALTLAAALA
jgi:hypothetical protein